MRSTSSQAPSFISALRRLGPALVALGAALLIAGPGRGTNPPRPAPQVVRAALTSQAPAAGRSAVELVPRTRNIEEVRVGDRVLSRDQATGRLVSGRVAEVFRRVADHLRIVEIRPSAGATTQVLRTTDEHPFWVIDCGWVDARDLVVGDELLGPDGSRGVVASTTREPHPEGVPVFNFRVEDYHDYFVAQHRGDGPVLVHNADYTPPGGGAAAEPPPPIRTGNWAKGSHDSAEESLKVHFAKHGQEVGATSIDQYLRKAEAFMQNLRGATKSPVPGATQGVTRFKKLGKYIDLDLEGGIISFGRQ